MNAIKRRKWAYRDIKNFLPMYCYLQRPGNSDHGEKVKLIRVEGDRLIYHLCLPPFNEKGIHINNGRVNFLSVFEDPKGDVY